MSEPMTPDKWELWVERYAELLGCENTPREVGAAIVMLLEERERQRKTIGRIRGQNAVLMQSTPIGASETVGQRLWREAAKSEGR